MLFNSLTFLIFFPAVLLVYLIIPRKIRYIWLLIASYYFYMSWNPEYALLLLGSTVTTYVAGLLIHKFHGKQGLQKTAVAVSLLINFGILFLFKYFNFIMDTIEKVLARAGITMAPASVSFLLPVGISFYIFQAVGYTVDVYREKIEPEKNFLRYALFVSFFPQLVAGPIERSGNLLRQLREADKIQVWNAKRMQQGALVMLYGYIMKMMLADRMAIYVDQIFDPELFSTYGGFTVLIATILFSFQVYCDFAGYTFIAIGAAKVMGFELMNNFDSPYLALSIKDFWDRWHISLSGWFRDYLYFPLGGSRKGKLRKYLNIMIVFTVSGLWHGAAWHYVFWGVLHGIMRIAGEATEKIRYALYHKLGTDTEVFSFKLLRRFLTFSWVTLAWVYFRAESVSMGTEMLKSIFTTRNPWVLFDGSLFEFLDAKEWNVMLIFLLLMVVVDIFRYLKKDILTFFTDQNVLFRALVFYVGIMALVVYGIYGAGYDAAQFIYFQF